MRPAALTLGLSLLALTLAPAAAEPVNPDLSQPSDSSGSSDPLAGAQKRMSLDVQAGAEQGFDRPGSMVIPTGRGNIQVNFSGQDGPAPPKAGESSGADRAALAVIAALLGVAVLLLPKKAEPPAVAPLPAAAPAPAAAPNLGGTSFAIVRVIGEGGMGVVYEAMDRTLDRRVAIKRLRDDTGGPSDRAQLIKEAKTVASLHHPNIVAIHTIVSQGGEDYIVFEFVEGRTIEDLIKERQRLTLAETRHILDPVCRALEFAHERGIIHRDLKPANVMLTTLGMVKVMDFGIARSIQAQAGEAPAPGAPARGFHVTHHITGTPLYLAPEAEFGIIRPEGDVYALGVMLYRMLSGLYPFPPPVTHAQKVAGRFAPLSSAVAGLPAGVDALVGDCLKPEAEQRLRTPKAFRERLEALLPKA